MVDHWSLVETHTCPELAVQAEALFTIGNGYVGVRGVHEEDAGTGRQSGNSTLVHGVFNYVEGDLSPDLAPVPEWLALHLKVDGYPFRIARGTERAGRVLGYERRLDLRHARLVRRILWEAPNGHVLRLEFERFASLAQRHVMALRLTVTALHGTVALHAQAGLDTDPPTPTPFQHWQPWETGAAGDEVWVRSTTTEGRYSLALCAAFLASDGAAPQVVATGVRPQLAYTRTLPQGESITFTKLVTLTTTREFAEPLDAAQSLLADARRAGYDALYEAHRAAWDATWATSAVDIEGDEFLQRALRFCIYHVLIAAPREDEHVSIGAKTLSGPGYRGHVFWDTDLFMVPMLTATQPHLARNLLMYRYHNLAGARAKAAAEGFEGAMFPWESADLGDEVTPKWSLPDASGKRIRIWTGELEQHVTSIIAYAVRHYWQWTGDDVFMRDHGAEIILDGARFWASRVEWDEAQRRYEINHVIGPDEYHDDINNSVFTNRMARWHLETAQEVWGWLAAAYPDHAARLAATLSLDEAAFERWKHVIDHLVIPFDPERQIHVQFDGFFDLEPVDVLAYEPRVHSLQSVFGYEETLKLRVIKQADVVMLMALLGESLAPPDVLENNWQTYYPVCDHGSSLSPAVHAWVAARLGHAALAYDLFVGAAGIDLMNNKGNSRDGIHGAACGGIWQALVYGFAGLRLTDDGITLDPRLPAHWRRARFSVCYRGNHYAIDIREGGEVQIDNVQP